jgi:protein arginine N-methyltransferase 1
MQYFRRAQYIECTVFKTIILIKAFVAITSFHQAHLVSFLNTRQQQGATNSIHLYKTRNIMSAPEPEKIEPKFANTSGNGEIPSYNGDEQAKATDFANYFCSYAQLYHQKQMLADHNRMAAYHSAILGNSDVFKDKVVMDVGTGSGILSVWAAQAGARKVYAIEYTDMAKHARQVMKANGVDDIVTVIQGAVEEIKLPIEEDGLEPDDPEHPERVVDIVISEWMGYFLLRESMLDSLIRARDKYLKPTTGLMFPSHCTMYVAPVQDEEERRANCNEHAGSMSDWAEFQDTTKQVYGVDMEVLKKDFDKEQKDYFLWSSRWRELPDAAVLAKPKPVKYYDMMTCTIEDSKGLYASEELSAFEFAVNGDRQHGPISAIAGWFTSDFKSRTDEIGRDTAPKLNAPAFLSTGPENGYTHWGQQVFYFQSGIPLMKGQTTHLTGSIEMTRTKENARLYNCRIKHNSTRTANASGSVLMNSGETEQVYMIP